MSRIYKHKCAVCSRVFPSTRSDAKFCGDTCRSRAFRHPELIASDVGPAARQPVSQPADDFDREVYEVLRQTGLHSEAHDRQAATRSLNPDLEWSAYRWAVLRGRSR